MKAATGFDAFWAAYPRRQKKKDARKAWGDLRPDAALIEQMIYALQWQRQQAQWLKEDGQFIPLAGSWIRGERWEDEEPVRAQRRGTGLNTFLIGES